MKKQVDGTKENAECSNRGVCETWNGVCLCSADFETSNGYNAEGNAYIHTYSVFICMYIHPLVYVFMYVCIGLHADMYVCMYV